MIEIDGVKHALERPITQAGDIIADEYLEAIDLSTARDLWQRDVNRLASAIRRLNRNQDTTCVYLGQAGLIETYNDVVGQLNDMNSGLPEVGRLLPLNADFSRVRNFSSSFTFA